MSAIVSLRDLVGGADTPDDFEKLLDECDCAGPGLSAIGAEGGDLELCVEGDIVMPAEHDGPNLGKFVPSLELIPTESAEFLRDSAEIRRVLMNRRDLRRLLILVE